MKVLTVTSRGLTKSDESLVQLLVNAGLKKNIAKTLVYLKKKEETTSVEIESATSLRQPEVSIAMQELRRRKWIIKRDIKKQGKGRPVHAYRLSVPFEEIITTIENDLRKRIEKIEWEIGQLKELSD
ncbi:MAG TPA: ArsR family transcriptional regulator [Euryarchaeota archaeon]|nr:ArsR family transcriptional regulator [Euryarchaeota archaeon]